MTEFSRTIQAYKNKIIDRKIRILALILMLLSGGGLDIGNIVGYKGSTALFFLFVITIFLINKITIRKDELKAPLICIGVMLVAYIIKGATFPIWCIAPVFIAFFSLALYRNCPHKFYEDFSDICRWYSYYSLISVILCLILMNMVQNSNFYRYSHLFYIFWFVTSGGPHFMNELRVTGLAGEPGIWQMYLSFNLLFTLYEKRSNKELIIAILSIVTIFSTTSYFIMMTIILYYFIIIERKIKFSHIIVLIILSILFFDIIYDNISDKLSGASGLTRLSDIPIGIMYLQKNPVFGIDPSITDESNDPALIAIKYAIWSSSKQIEEGYIDSGLCSGIMWFLLDYGLIFSFYLIYKLLKFPLINNKKLYGGILCILFLTFMTEPLSRTAFFYFLIMGAFIKFNWNNNNKILKQ